jgi:hypothetical protein
MRRTRTPTTTSGCIRCCGPARCDSAALLAVGADRRACLGAGALGAVRAPSRTPVTSVAAIGRTLFTDYAFQFEVTSILILVAMVGAVLMARREDPPGSETLMPSLNDYLILSAVLFTIGTAACSCGAT